MLALRTLYFCHHSLCSYSSVILCISRSWVCSVNACPLKSMHLVLLLLYWAFYVPTVCVLKRRAPSPSSNLLCVRFHVAHVVLAALAALDDSRAEGLYDRLRTAYNPFRPPRSLPVPPLEEWQGVSLFCEDLHCRCVGVSRLQWLPTSFAHAER